MEEDSTAEKRITLRTIVLKGADYSSRTRHLVMEKDANLHYYQDGP